MPRPAPADPPVAVGRLPKSQVDALDRRARELGLSRAALLTRLLDRSGLLEGVPATTGRQGQDRGVRGAREAPQGRMHEWKDHPTFGKVCGVCRTPRRQATRFCAG